MSRGDKGELASAAFLREQVGASLDISANDNAEKRQGKRRTKKGDSAVAESAVQTMQFDAETLTAAKRQVRENRFMNKEQYSDADISDDEVNAAALVITTERQKSADAAKVAELAANIKEGRIQAIEDSWFVSDEAAGVKKVAEKAPEPTTNVEKMQVLQTEIDELENRLQDVRAQRESTRFNVMKIASLALEERKIIGILNTRGQEYNTLLSEAKTKELSNSDLLSDEAMATRKGPASRSEFGRGSNAENVGTINFQQSGEITQGKGLDRAVVPAGVANSESAAELTTTQAYEQMAAQYKELVDRGTEFSQAQAADMLEQLNALKAEKESEEAIALDKKVKAILAEGRARDAEAAYQAENAAENPADRKARAAEFAAGNVAMATPKGPGSRTNIGDRRTGMSAGAVNIDQSTGVEKPFVPAGVASPEIKGVEPLTNEQAMLAKQKEFNELVVSKNPVDQINAQKVLAEFNLLAKEVTKEQAVLRSEQAKLAVANERRIAEEEELAEIGANFAKQANDRFMVRKGPTASIVESRRPGTKLVEKLDRRVTPAGVANKESVEPRSTEAVYGEVTAQIERLQQKNTELKEGDKADLEKLLGDRAAIIDYARDQMDEQKAIGLHDLIAKFARAEKKGQLSQDFVNKLLPAESALFQEVCPAGLKPDTTFLGENGKGWNKTEKNPLYKAWREVSGSGIKVE